MVKKMLPEWATDLYERGAEVVALLKSTEKELDRLRERCDVQTAEIVELKKIVYNLEHELKRVEERARSEGREAAQAAILSTYGDTLKGFFEMRAMLEEKKNSFEPKSVESR